MIELNKRQYEILTFMANTGVKAYVTHEDAEYSDLYSLYVAGLCNTDAYAYIFKIAPHAREMFRDAGFRRIN
jgi:hypothetical protein